MLEQTDKSNTAELEYAGFWARVGASLVDGILMLLVAIPAIVSIYGWEYYDNPETASLFYFYGFWDFLFNWIWPFVFAIFFWIKFQATPGKMLIARKIVDARTGNPPSKAQYVGRYLAYFISALPLGLGFFWVAFDKRKQGWHDKLAGTVVIRNKKQSASEPVSFMKVFSGIVGGFALGLFAMFVSVMLFATDSEKAGNVGAAAFLISWALTIVVAFFSKSAAKVWRRVFLAIALLLLLTPISALIFSGKNVKAAAEKGDALEVAANVFAGGAFSALFVVVGFFLGAFFLIIGLLTGREKS